jgi:hypothetical protein
VYEEEERDHEHEGAQGGRSKQVTNSVQHLNVLSAARATTYWRLAI